MDFTILFSIYYHLLLLENIDILYEEIFLQSNIFIFNLKLEFCAFPNLFFIVT